MHSEDRSNHSELEECKDIVEAEAKNAKNSLADVDLFASNLRDETNKTNSKEDNKRTNKDGILAARHEENALTTMGKDDLDLQDLGEKNPLEDDHSVIDDDFKHKSEGGKLHNNGDSSKDVPQSFGSIQVRDGVSGVSGSADKTSLPDADELRNRSSGGSSKVKVRPKRSVRKVSSGANKREVVVNGNNRPYSPGNELEAKKISKIVARKLNFYLNQLRLENSFDVSLSSSWNCQSEWHTINALKHRVFLPDVEDFNNRRFSDTAIQTKDCYRPIDANLFTRREAHESTEREAKRLRRFTRHILGSYYIGKISKIQCNPTSSPVPKGIDDHGRQSVPGSHSTAGKHKRRNNEGEDDNDKTTSRKTSNARRNDKTNDDCEPVRHRSPVRLQHLSRHFGAALNTENYRTFYFDQGLHTGNLEESLRLQKLKLKKTKEVTESACPLLPRLSGSSNRRPWEGELNQSELQQKTTKTTTTTTAITEPEGIKRVTFEFSRSLRNPQKPVSEWNLYECLEKGISSDRKKSISASVPASQTSYSVCTPPKIHDVSDSTTKRSVSPANDTGKLVEKLSQDGKCEEAVLNSSARELDEPMESLSHTDDRIRNLILENDDDDTTVDREKTVLHVLDVVKKERFEDRAADEENQAKRKESPTATSRDFYSRNNRPSIELSTEIQPNISEIARLDTSRLDDRPTVAEETDNRVNIEKSRPTVDIEKDIFD